MYRRGGTLLTGQESCIGQGPGQADHQGLVGHGVDHASHDALLVPAASEVAVEEIGDAGVAEQQDGGEVLVLEDEVADEGRGEEAREGEEIGERVDVFSEKVTDRWGALGCGWLLWVGWSVGLLCVCW